MAYDTRQEAEAHIAALATEAARAKPSDDQDARGPTGWFMNSVLIGSTAGLGNIPTSWTVQGVSAD